MTRRTSFARRYGSAVVVSALSLLFAGCGNSAGGVVPFKEDPSLKVTDIPPASPEQQRLVPKGKGFPKSVTMGDTLRYTVDLRNPTDSAISLDPCPGYYQAWGESGTAVFDPGVLNCDDAPSEIDPGATVSFAMELDIPKSIEGQDCFEGGVVWYLGRAGKGAPTLYSDFINACTPEAQEKEKN